jgi:hypothetical protein
MCKVFKTVSDKNDHSNHDKGQGLTKSCELGGKIFGAIMPLSNDYNDVGEDFWASVEYCGYIRHTYEPGSMRRISTFANHAFARLAGLPNPAAVIRR